MASDKNITLPGLLIKPNDNDDSGDDDAKNTPIIFGKSLPSGIKPGANLLDYYGAFLRPGVVRSVMMELS